MADQTTIKNMRILVRRDLASEWTKHDPILLVGEQGYETDLGGLKFGDGKKTWSQLPYFTGFTAIDGGGPDAPWG